MTESPTTHPAIRPFRIDVPEEDLRDLRRRVAATRWPDRETVSDRSQGVQLASLQPLVEYWGTGYDWRKVEATINALPQLIIEIDGLDIQFAHIRSPITLYWLTNTGVSASRLYWEYKGGFFNAKGVSIPVAVSAFPGEQYQAPKSWAEQAYPNLIHYNRLDKGGHFAAWEQPQLFAAEVRAGFRSLR